MHWWTGYTQNGEVGHLGIVYVLHLWYFAIAPRDVTIKVMNDCNMCGWTSKLLFSWSGTMLLIDVMHCSYITL